MLLSTTSLTKARVKTTSGGTRRDSAPQIFGTCLLFYSAARPGGESCRRHENPQGLTARVVGGVQMLHRWDKLVDGQQRSQKCDIPINLHTYLHRFTLLENKSYIYNHLQAYALHLLSQVLLVCGFLRSGRSGQIPRILFERVLGQFEFLRH